MLKKMPTRPSTQGVDLAQGTELVFQVTGRSIGVMAGIAAFFVVSTAACHLIFGQGTANLIGFSQIIDVDAEGNLPTWYAAALLHLAALLAWMIATSDEENVIQWKIIAVLLLLMGVDEVASLHNAPSRRLGELLGNQEGIMMNAWVIPGGILCLCVAIGFWRFLLRQPRWLSWGLAISAALYVTGALLLEMAGTYVEFETAGFNYDGDQFYSLKYELITVLEELFEYSGVILAIYLFLRRAGELESRISVTTRLATAS